MREKLLKKNMLRVNSLEAYEAVACVCRYRCECKCQSISSATTKSNTLNSFARTATVATSM